MTFRAAEDSEYGGAPQLFVLMRCGTSFWRVTPGDAPASIDDPESHEYSPLRMALESVSMNEEAAAGNLALTIPVDHDVAVLWNEGPPPEPVIVTVRGIHRSDPDREVNVFFTGQALNCERNGADAKLTCAPFFGRFRKRIPAVLYSAQCAYAVFEAGCDLDPAPFTVSGTVAEVTGSSIRADVFATHPDGWWKGGQVIFADGRRRMITGHVGDVVDLMFAKAGLEVGDAFTARPGCDGTETVCHVKYNNTPHHGGFSHIPPRNPFERSFV